QDKTRQDRMTICPPVAASNWLFWSSLDDKLFSTPTFVLQRYGGPLWWAAKYRILLLVEGGYANGYLIAHSSSYNEIIEHWAIIMAVYLDKVEKTGLSHFSERYLLHLFKKLAKKMTMFTDHTEEHQQQQQQQQHQDTTSTQPQQQHSIPSNNSIVSSLDEASKPSSNIRIGVQRHVAKLFNVLYHHDPITILERVFSSEFPSNEWVEWMDDHTGMRPIHLAVEKMDMALIKYLLDKKADVNVKDKQGWSPLHFAAYAGNLDVCRLLVEQGNAAVMTISKDGTLPLHYLARHTFSEAEVGKFTQLLSLLLSRGTPINARTIRGETAMHRAGYFGSTQVVQFLLDNKADLNVQNERGETALYFAIIGHNTNIATLMVEHGADCNIGGATGSALDAARKTGQTDLLLVLTGQSKSDELEHEGDHDHVEPTNDTAQEVKAVTDTSTSNTDNNNNNNNNDEQVNEQTVVQDIIENKATTDKQQQQTSATGFYPHVFVLKDFKGPVWCSLCGYFLWGIRRQGFACEVCGYCVHPKCKKKATLTEPCSVSRKRLEGLYNQFNTLDKDQQGYLYKKEFGDCLGPMISDAIEFADAIFQSFDTNMDGKMDLKDFLNGVSLLQNASFEEQVQFAFNMLDRNKLGYVTVREFLNILQSIFHSLANLKINSVSPAVFICTIFPKTIVFKRREPYGLSPNPNNVGTPTTSQIHQSIQSPPPVQPQQPTSPYQPGKLTKSLSVDSRIGKHRGSLDPIVLSTIGSPEHEHDQEQEDDHHHDHEQEQEQEPDSEPESQAHILSTLGSMMAHSTTTSTSTTEPSYDDQFTKKLNFDGRIYFEDYRIAMLRHSHYVQSLGVVENNSLEEQNQMSKWMSFEGKEITLGHDNWLTMQYIMIGIRKAIGEALTLPTRKLKQKDYDVVVEFKYDGWTFRDCSPLPFKKVRDRLGIDPKYYMFTLGPEKIFGNLLMGNLSVLCEVVSSGRSGSMFFRSNEGRYLLKTIPQNEEAVLKSILPAYVQHLERHPNSLLAKTLGCYSMMKTKDFRFIVMNNLFFTPLPIHEKYDLKGSTIGRHVEHVKDEDNPANIAEVALKDLDFKRKLHIGPELKAALMEQIEHDTMLLESNNICDYSLLVGVHRIDEFSPLALDSDNPESSSRDIIDMLDEGFFKSNSSSANNTIGKSSIFQQHYGGILSSDKKEVYFIAIIDILTSWDFRKKYENMFKSLVHESSQLSAIDPARYRKRFQQLVHHIV
ncbi:hypothetical protein SAMD00019534_059890, partial [Acytostelium subglobosum LB1]|uniref:hypothetical protein n=1 Tax=Acytostelium subglobosum LB1 TaxID=1410327 RepID=UPI00064515BB